MGDAGSVMILAIRSARQSSYPSSVGRFDLLAVEGKAATLEMQGRKTHVGSVICPACCLAVYTPCRLAVAIEVKIKVKVGEKVDAEVKMLEKHY